MGRPYKTSVWPKKGVVALENSSYINAKTGRKLSQMSLYHRTYGPSISTLSSMTSPVMIHVTDDWLRSPAAHFGNKTP